MFHNHSPIGGYGRLQMSDTIPGCDCGSPPVSRWRRLLRRLHLMPSPPPYCVGHLGDAASSIIDFDEDRAYEEIAAAMRSQNEIMAAFMAAAQPAPGGDDGTA